MFTFENDFWEKNCRRLAGIDEAGRGALAGPVVAAAVLLPAYFGKKEIDEDLKKLNDSKQLSPRQRQFFYTLLHSLPEAEIGVGMADVKEIEEVNILQATHLAMRRALLALPQLPEHALVDGLPVKNLPCPSTAIAHGDSRSFLVAAASIIAKVTRDTLMQDMDQDFPAYGFAQHKGYGTQKHIQSLLRHGSTPQHRHSFRPVREIDEIRKKSPRNQDHETHADLEKYVSFYNKKAPSQTGSQSLFRFMG